MPVEKGKPRCVCYAGFHFTFRSEPLPGRLQGPISRNPSLFIISYVERGSLTRARDILLEKDHPRTRLKGTHINKYVNVFAPSVFQVTKEMDEESAEKARLLLENVIPELFQWFSSEGAWIQY